MKTNVMSANDSLGSITEDKRSSIGRAARGVLPFVATLAVGVALGYVAGSGRRSAAAAHERAIGFSIDEKSPGGNVRREYDVYRITDPDRGVIFGTVAPPAEAPVIVTIEHHGRTAYYGLPRRPLTGQE